MTENEGIYKILLDMKEDMGEMKSDIKSTLEQTRKTNGRVTALEIWREKIVTEKAYNAGKLAIISLLGGALATVLWAFFSKKLGL